MFEETVEAVRLPLVVRPPSRRHIEERLALRFPRLVPLLARQVWRLPRRSRLRQAIIRRALRFVYEATNRGDHQAQVLLVHPDCEMLPPRQLAGLGWGEVRGPEARARFQQRWHEEWGQFQFEPEYAVDLGERLLVIGTIAGSGLSSGAQVGAQWANLFTISEGQAIREEAFLSHAEGLDAAGLSESTRSTP